MKSLTWKLVLPLTIISQVVFIKYWYVKIQGFDEVLKGFPFPFICPAWHTSLSYQIFLAEFVADLLIHFAFWFLLVYSINRYIKKIRMHKSLLAALLIIAGLISIGPLLWIGIITYRDHLFYFEIPFDIDIVKTEFRFFNSILDRGLALCCI